MNHLRDTLQRLVHTIIGHDGRKEFGYLIVALLQDIFVIEPNAFLIVELGTGLGTLGDVESLHQLLQREHLLLRTGIPA